MRTLPMFPLGNPLVPYAAIPLHIFEDRYRAMVRACLDGDREFGIVMIERGSEVGGNDQRSSIGTLARIAEAQELEDGRWILLVVGTGRLQVIEWLPDDPYPRAVVEELPSPSSDLSAGDRDDLQARVRRLAGMLVELGEPSVPLDVVLADDPVAAGFQAVAVSPVGPLDIQRILAIDDHGERHAAITDLLTEAESLLDLQMRS